MVEHLLQRVAEGVYMSNGLSLMLASKTTMTIFDALNTISSSLLQWALLLSLEWQSALWNEKWLVSPRQNSLLRESKDGKIPLRQLLASLMELLIFTCCLVLE